LFLVFPFFFQEPETHDELDDPNNPSRRGSDAWDGGGGGGRGVLRSGTMADVTGKLKTKILRLLALQRTATHCNTLQHTATRCNTLRHTAAHCDILQRTATRCDTPQHTATRRNTLHHTATGKPKTKTFRLLATFDGHGDTVTNVKFHPQVEIPKSQLYSHFTQKKL